MKFLGPESLLVGWFIMMMVGVVDCVVGCVVVGRPHGLVWKEEILEKERMCGKSFLHWPTVQLFQI